MVAAEENVGAVPATVELLVTLVELKVATSLPEESCIALASSLPEGSVSVSYTHLTLPTKRIV